MRPGDAILAKEIKDKLIAYHNCVSALPGIQSKESIDCFVEQIVDSIRRIKYVEVIRDRKFDGLHADPRNAAFDPVKAASWHIQNGSIDEAFWLAFLSVHFGKHSTTSWNLVREFYKAAGRDSHWDWLTINAEINQLQQWLLENKENLRSLGSFGNHRKYQSLNPETDDGTYATLNTYVQWVGGNHMGLINSAVQQIGANPEMLFDYFFNSMDQISGFGRMAKFDYLCLIGKLNLAQIEPGSCYINGSTGPRIGAKLLFGGDKNAEISTRDLNDHCIQLADYLNLYFGMQVLEDALCNWQKSPTAYIYFGG